LLDSARNYQKLGVMVNSQMQNEEHGYYLTKEEKRKELELSAKTK